MKYFHIAILLLFPFNFICAQSISIERSEWKLKYIDSYQPGAGGELAFDNNPSTHWHSKWGTENPLPHEIQIDLGNTYNVNGFAYLPRIDGGNGTIKEYEFYVSEDGEDWGKPVASGEFQNKKSINNVYFPVINDVRYIKLVAKSEFNGNKYYATAAEIYVMQLSYEKPKADFSTPANQVKAGNNIIFTDCSTVSPTSWEWTFEGGNPEKSTLQNPCVTYNKAGDYKVTLTAINPNGANTVTKEKYIKVSDNYHNQAICLDGLDNDLRIGMDVIKNNWTIEAWIKGNDNDWKDTEVIIGAGEYGYINTIDPLPLVIKNGRLHSSKANISSNSKLDNNWHHIAASCDGKSVRLYIDGIEVAKADTAISILPGNIGGNTNTNTTFGGLIDEVRIWETALPPSIINEWKSKPITPVHEHFKNLAAYYDFDELHDGVVINRVGKGHLAYHLRNGRVGYYGDMPLAYLVTNDNSSFVSTQNKKQSVFNAVCIQGEWDADKGTKDNQILKLRIITDGNKEAVSLTELNLDLSESTNIKDIEKIHVYYTGQIAKSEIKKELFNGNPKKVLKIKFKDPQILASGVNYILLTFDINKDATLGNTIDARISDFKLGKHSYKPEQAEYIKKQITVNNAVENIYKVLQWNIWHGGVHVGNNGRERIKDLIKLSHADIITMQEAYGTQEMLAESLSYHMQTNSSRDNLALFSRYPMERIKSESPFNSNPAKIKLPNGRIILMNDWWLRYEYEEEYTCNYVNNGLDIDKWIKGDKELSLVDAEKAFKNDINPNITNPLMPVIIGGDFNSGSHLDWTKAAAHLHNGYYVDLPTSKYMISNGYKDSFREINPDELKYQGGTFAEIFGHLQNSRIDFIYYKGSGIKAISSKIIRTAPEIDDVWASDHSAVLTVFEIKPD